MNKKQLGLAMAVALGLTAAPAGAAFINEWSYEATLEWVLVQTDFGAPIGVVEAPVYTGGTGSTFNSTSLLSWGATGGDHTVSGLAANLSRSALEIGGSPAVGFVDTNGPDEDTTTITHFNNAISAGFSTLTSASLLTTLTLTPADPAGAPLPTFPVVFKTDFIETENTSPCGFPAGSVCDDIFVVADPGSLSGTFEVDGIIYTATIVANGLGPLPADTCETALGAGNTVCSGLTTLENANTEVQFGFNIKADVAVPEPATVALLGLGLAGLGASVATRRRRRQE